MIQKQKKKRMLQILFTLFGVSLITFSLVHLSPGDAAEIMLSDCGIIPDPHILAQARTDLGLDQPLHMQYWQWLARFMRGDLGESYAFKMPVIEKLLQSFVPTLKLALVSLMMTLVMAIPFGFLSAIYQNSWIDFLLRGLSFFGLSVPSFWLGLIFLRFFGVHLGWVNVAGGTTAFPAVLLPAFTLAIAMTAKYLRQIRIIVIEELQKDYVIGARMRGLSEEVILRKHILPNIVTPLLTLIGLSFGSLLGGTAVVEIIYNWPGLGSMAVTAISSRDFPLIQGYVMMIALFYLLINLVVDWSYTKLDPRGKEAFT